MNHFITWWLGIFIVTLVFLSFVGFVPQKMRQAQNLILSALMNEDVYASDQTGQDEKKDPPQEVVITERPTHLSIPTVGITFAIVESESTAVEILDAALTKGIVHYPGSGLLGEDTNVLLFGHSSHLKYVRNPAYRALTGIEKLQSDDRIIVRGEKNEYIYSVISVRLTDKNEELVQFDSAAGKLTISTCNTFGSKDDRYVVTADLLAVLPIEQNQ